MSQFPNHSKLYHQSAFRPVYPAIGHPDFEPPKLEPKRTTKTSPKETEPDRSPSHVLKKEADDSSDSNESDVYSKTPEDEDETVDIETTDDLTEVSFLTKFSYNKTLTTPHLQTSGLFAFNLEG